MTTEQDQSIQSQLTDTNYAHLRKLNTHAVLFHQALLDADVRGKFTQDVHEFSRITEEAMRNIDLSPNTKLTSE